MDTYECKICCLQHPKEDVYKLANCSHGYCKECLNLYILTEIPKAGVKEIICPECKTPISYYDVKDNVNSLDQIKYDGFLLENSLSKDPNYRTCPNKKCEFSLICDPDSTKITCPNGECKFAYCFNCKDVWHADVTCEKYQKLKLQNDIEQKQLEKWVSLHAKKCPNCKVNIEKNRGCNHMKCTKCSYYFCWQCLNAIINNKCVCK
ncbi:hypothetical protein DICPUDRAFT_84702 [Dictyostelium purpureum]|uniref:RBR-type E3 ubiquitin transferase n=1 Tax=Dictyostelium purpureum TaxID=5786 RepID=F1A3H2_DICPU|nr:uncharacterized protein DICPUDRAFT_84702 [Dictyostelium purpureum]EGC29260.1 hypothetical protein DICPUDRAFT_84702 [Dictyostelium purpureum]|eukprot:XP_003294213.1 hypothetical protein DICPUDRAFT_84702 [Dictyostelium purpureum]